MFSQEFPRCIKDHLNRVNPICQQTIHSERCLCPLIALIFYQYYALSWPNPASVHIKLMKPHLNFWAIQVKAVPGAADVVRSLQAEGLKVAIASTFSGEVHDHWMRVSHSQGFTVSTNTEIIVMTMSRVI